MDSKKELFETMPVPRALASLAIPTIISQLITMIYNLADTYFVGITNDPYKVAATSITFVLFFVANALSNLFGVGGGSLISRLLGRREPEEAKKVCAYSLYGAFALSLIYSICCGVFMEPLLRMLGASDHTIGYCTAYGFWVVVIGGVPATMGLTMAHILRSEGYSRQASLGLGMGGMLNIILDPVFMFLLLPPGMEVEGAAIATTLSNVISLVYFIIVFCKLKNQTVISASAKLLRPALKYTGEIFSIGFPSALSSLLSSAANITINSLVAGYGDIPVAAMGIVKKIDMLPLNVSFGLCQGMMPLVAYNYAAKNYKRMNDVANFTRVLGMGFSALCIVLFEIFASGLVNLFIDEMETVVLGTAFLRIACLATPFMVCNFQMTYMLQAMGKGRHSLLLSACRQGLINIPLLFVMNHLFGLRGLVWTQLLADGITLCIVVVLYQSVKRNLPAQV